MKDLLEVSLVLSEELERLRFSPPVAYVYNPLEYAREPHEQYLSWYGKGRKEVVFVGMNPGPWGMTQTGVPFGEVAMVREWLQINGRVLRPDREHPKKKVEGFECRRSEVSGRRLWGLIRDTFCCPADFFSRYFVLNYCPLLFLDACGRNVTPDKLRTVERVALQSVCDRALRHSIEALSPAHVIGVGNFAAEQARVALEGLNVTIGKILHPSPSCPAANRGWKETVLDQLHDQGIEFARQERIGAQWP